MSAGDWADDRAEVEMEIEAEAKYEMVSVEIAKEVVDKAFNISHQLTLDDRAGLIEFVNSHAEVSETASADLLQKIKQAATRWPRCCDLWQDSLGGLRCTACDQKTFAMLKEIQQLLGVDKECRTIKGTVA